MRAGRGWRDRGLMFDLAAPPSPSPAAVSVNQSLAAQAIEAAKYYGTGTNQVRALDGVDV